MNKISLLRPVNDRPEHLFIEQIGISPACVRMAASPAFTWHEKDAVIYRDGAVMTNDGALCWLGLVSKNYLDLSKVLRPEPESFHVEPCAFIGGSENFGHAIFEDLTRVAVLDLSGHGNLPLAVWPGAKVTSFLDLLGKPYTTVEPACRFSDVVIPSCPLGRTLESTPFGWRDAIWWLRHNLIPKAECGERRIYCRRVASHRNVSNEDEVIEALTNLGFECLDLSELPLAEQINTVAEAEVLVIAGGACSPMAAFARCPVIEFCVPQVVGTFGAQIFCGTLGLPYRRMDGIPKGTEMNSDYGIDISDLENLVDSALSGGMVFLEKLAFDI